MTTFPTPGQSAAVYLRPEVKLEPLVCKWYAWPHLIAPAQLAMNVAFRLLPQLQSFVSNPAVHAVANADPKLYGGPFVALEPDDVQRVRALIDATATDCAELVQLAQDLKTLDATLQEKATGYCLNEFYPRLPASLRGLVELVYDLNNHPSIRLFEGLLYDDDLTSRTQEILLQPVPERGRKFFMSTPRLPTPGSVALRLEFSDPRIDVLARSRREPVRLDELCRLFEGALPADAMDDFRALFTDQAPAGRGDQAPAGAGVRVRYFGHACVLLQSATTSILVDPFVAIEPGDDGRFSIADLPERIDYVVISHSHHDHCAPEILLQLRHRIGRILVPRNNTGCLADPSTKLILSELGFDNVDVLDPLDTVAVPGGEILSLPFAGEHCDLNIYSKQAIAVTLEGRKFMFLVDSDGWDTTLYERAMRRLGRLDALFLGMECQGAPLNWLYEPLLTRPVNRRNNESRRLSGADSERAWKVLEATGLPPVFVYAMGQERWMNYVMGLEYEPDSIQLLESAKFLDRCERAGIPARRLYGAHEQEF